MSDEKRLVIRDEQRGISAYNDIENPIEFAVKLGAMLSRSGMFGCKSAEQGQVLAWHCMVKKKDPIDVMREYYITPDGKMGKRYQAMLAQFKRNGGKWKWLSSLNDKMEARAKITDTDGDTYEWSFTIEDASGFAYTTRNNQRVLKDNWRNHTPDMLRARLVTKALSMLDPDIVCGADDDISDVSDALSGSAPAPLFTRPDPCETPEPKRHESNDVQDAEYADDDAAKAEPEKPVDQAKPSPAKKAPAKKGGPGAVQEPEPKTEPAAGPTIDQIREAIFQQYKDEAVFLDRFAVAKKWVLEEEGFPSVDDEKIQWIWKNMQQFDKTFQAYKRRWEDKDNG